MNALKWRINSLKQFFPFLLVTTLMLSGCTNIPHLPALLSAGLNPIETAIADPEPAPTTTSNRLFPILNSSLPAALSKKFSSSESSQVETLRSPSLESTQASHSATPAPSRIETSLSESTLTSNTEPSNTEPSNTEPSNTEPSDLETFPIALPSTIETTLAEPTLTSNTEPSNTELSDLETFPIAPPSTIETTLAEPTTTGNTDPTESASLSIATVNTRPTKSENSSTVAINGIVSCAIANTNLNANTTAWENSPTTQEVCH